jgi:hypothetical protein
MCIEYIHAMSKRLFFPPFLDVIARKFAVVMKLKFHNHYVEGFHQLNIGRCLYMSYLNKLVEVRNVQTSTDV